MIKVGIIGGAGYTAGELIRILINHPSAEISFVQSSSHSGDPLWSVHQDLTGDTDMAFCSEAQVADVDVIFLCSGHGKSKGLVHSLPDDYKGAIIDLSNDFRLKADAEDFVYGLPEAFRAKIRNARHIANPGCFATSIQLAILPMAKADKLGEIQVTGITGSTGAGQKPSETTHFSWRSDNISVYKPFTHQHLGEINETLRTLAPSYRGDLNFVPIRGDFARGILSSVYFDCDIPEAEVVKLYHDYYDNEPFVTVADCNPDLKMVVNTNKCVLSVKKYGHKLHIVSVIDNLVKGASGQAIENMNLVFGLPEQTGLKLKASRF
ncbi:MAG: N-acetyl-gamma-glutamyl-phosphate reductase [Bacteroidales bacterium]|jgi:N-acetyl-gamma-glutamyl-phosphate reductase|nr:N-acetyl-gamma-glutamyl-phosphate reductase [Bacteroidales bacterium]MCI1785217.1 N-acetyl-gamma-glutamyl-phosphate reductase [Bacteroidales bacterium]